MVIDLDEPARFGLRAFIQRCESRLSTMHAIAGAFISGAGLLILLPVLYRDYASQIVLDVAEAVHLTALNSPYTLSTWRSLSWPTVWDVAPIYWILPLSFSLVIPGYAIYLLIRELVLFYFVPHGYDPSGARYFVPRFALSALSFPTDEGVRQADIPAMKSQARMFSPVAPYFLSQG